MLEASKVQSSNSKKQGGEKIGFEKMAKTIGKRWKELPAAELDRFKTMAKEDTERYRQEMDSYNYSLAMKGRKEREESRRRREEAEQQNAPLNLSSNISAGTVGTFGAQQQVTAALLGGDSAPDMGSLAAAHLLGRVGGRSHSMPPQFVASSANFGGPSISAQLVQALSHGGPAAAQPATNQQVLHGLFTATRQDALPDTRLLECLATSQNQARLDDQFMQNLLSRAHTNQANQELMASLPPSVQQQLLVQFLRGGNSGLLSGSLSSTVPSNTTGRQDSSSATDLGRYPF